ncbi:hypothetical protein VE03_03499 [Pseudogymnoascus sp. 23342-1-I1]|nr:hypothetical protein VE03_03499 [Pseudogymnoascus sp. 23342-1-I1]
MTSVGRIQANLVSANSDVTAALLNINFDFAVVKLAAPAEFHELGQSLSSSRRVEAEEGKLHSTARKLGALFEPLLPETPELLRCYGLRASEIASKCKQAHTIDHGFFHGQAGVDASSIWAAATSGEAAIRVHLLACMLARIWNGPEAISIWVEIVEGRKREIDAALNRTGSLEMKSFMASKQDISRADLANWDASARAWLRVADAAKDSQQKQLLLIIGNIPTHVNSKPQLYDSVIHTWKEALEGVELLLSGSPQKMQSGELLLGLSAWHLYPDLNVLDVATAIVRQQDPLVPASGILTIGLKREDDHDVQGLEWSLPLAHLRYYGDPVSCTRHVGAEGSRLSLDEFRQAVLGCVLGGWGVPDVTDETVLTFIISLADAVQESAQVDRINGLFFYGSWLQLLKTSAQRFLDSTGTERRFYRQLLHLGIKHASFIGRPPTPFFGLLQSSRFLHLQRGQGNKVRALRKLAASSRVSSEDVIIRYISDVTRREEFATALPRSRLAHKRSFHEDTRSCAGHIRWLHSVGHNNRYNYDTHSMYIDFDAEYSEQTLQHPSKDVVNQPSDQDTALAADFTSQKSHYENLGETVKAVSDEPITTVFEKKTRLFEKASNMRLVIGPIDNSAGLSNYEPWFGDVSHFEYWFGDRDSTDSCAVYSRMKQDIPDFPSQVDFTQLSALFKGNNMNTTRFLPVFEDALSSLGSSYIKSLQALATIDALYKTKKSSTIDVRVLKSHLSTTKWLHSRNSDPARNQHDVKKPQVKTKRLPKDEETNANVRTGHISTAFRSDFFEEALGGVESSDEKAYIPKELPNLDYLTSLGKMFWSTRLDRTSAFACILSLETGVFNLSPEQLKNVMAISSGNSLYIAAELLSDPDEVVDPSDIRHVMGNIGKPGIALLVPPVAPKIKQVGIEQWNLINHEPWEGKPQDCFQNTSLHLWFTGSIVPINVGSVGAQDTEIYVLESVISVHGQGMWIADLDILKTLSDPSLHQSRSYEARLLAPSAPKTLEWQSHCPKGHKQENQEHQDYQQNSERLVALENWVELLETVSDHSILLAKGNWQARLAAASICITQGKPVLLVRETPCWSCVAEYMGSLHWGGRHITLLY